MGKIKSWALVGGGLFNCLMALRLSQKGYPFQVFERARELAGDHTWSFHQSDLSAENLAFIRPAITREWSGYSVEFPGYQRQMSGGYLTIRSSDLRHEVLRHVPAENIHCGVEWKGSSSNEIVIRADGVSALPESCGWQKFVGWDVVFENPHGLTAPVLMDVTVEQKDGFRFLYILPFDTHRALIEDTRYSNSSHINAAEFHADLIQYINGRWPGSKWRSEREEMAALPIPTEATGERGRFGMAGGFFQPTTGYSLPYAVRISADLIHWIESGLNVNEAWDRIDSQIKANQHFYLMLNRMMFFAARPTERWRIFSRFYKLSPGLIERFYAGRSNGFDKIRILAGRPPVPVWSAVRVLLSPERVPVWN